VCPVAVLVKLLIATFAAPHKSQRRRDADDPPVLSQSVGPPLEASVGHRTRPQPPEAQRLTPKSQWRSAPFKIAAMAGWTFVLFGKCKKLFSGVSTPI
jgi:hypothetical protein